MKTVYNRFVKTKNIGTKREIKSHIEGLTRALFEHRISVTSTRAWTPFVRMLSSK